MKRFNWLLIGLMVLGLATGPLAGCVSKSEYEAVQAEYEAVQAEYEALQEEDICELVPGYTTDTCTEVGPEAVEGDWLIKRRFRQHNGRLAQGDTFDCDLKFIATQPVRIRGWIVGITLGQIWQAPQPGYIGGCTEVTRGTTSFTNAVLDRCFTYFGNVGNMAQNEIVGATGVGVNRMKEFYDRQMSDDLGLMLNPGETIEVHSNIHNGIGVPTTVTIFVIWFYEEV